ncbi:MAG: hypothetical protein KC478_03510 [Bacteriovoracaceae bacterium]|nr:hypothetical protein [Bacteriovoracaceae bacterium]
MHPSFGVQYRYDEQIQLGTGISYEPSNSTSNEGSNITTFTSGFSHQHKNYIGTFTLFYISAEDAGGNVVWNANTDQDEKVDLGYSEVGLSFSGSYFF